MVTLRFGKIEGIQIDSMPNGRSKVSMHPELVKFKGPVNFLNRISELLKRSFPDAGLEYDSRLVLERCGPNVAEITLELDQIAGGPVKKSAVQPLVSEFVANCLPQVDFVDHSQGGAISEEQKQIVQEEALTFLADEGGKTSALPFEVDVDEDTVGVVQQPYAKPIIEAKEPEYFEFKGRYDGMSISDREVVFRTEGTRSKKIRLKYKKTEEEKQIAAIYFKDVELWKVQAKRSFVGNAEIVDLIAFEEATADNDPCPQDFELISESS